MFARVTQFDVDTLEISLDAALERFKETIVPALHAQPGYQGASLMRTSEGRGLLITYWSTQEAAQAGIESGFYQRQIAQFLTFYRQPPGREHYEVVFTEEPVAQDAA